MALHGRLLQGLGLFALVLAVICTAVLFAKGHPAMMIVWPVVLAVFALPLIVRGWVDAWSFLSGRTKPPRHECPYCGALLSEDKPENCPGCKSQID